MRIKHCLSLLIVASVSLAAVGADAPKPPAEVPAFAKQLPTFKSGEPVFAFNGKNLDGWYTYINGPKYEDPNKVFTVQDGMLRISGQGFGGITTKQTFKDYHLVAEWKWGEKTWDVPGGPTGLFRAASAARDAGILVHCVGEDGAFLGHWMESMEVQIIEGGVGDFLVLPGPQKATLTVESRVLNKAFYFEPGGTPVVKKSGRINWWGRDPAWTDTLNYRGPRDVEAPHGEWNRLEVLCDGDTITILLNGYLVNHGTKSGLTEGKIQLQTEGAEIFYRKVEVRPLIKGESGSHEDAKDTKTATKK